MSIDLQSIFTSISPIALMACGFAIGFAILRTVTRSFEEAFDLGSDFDKTEEEKAASREPEPIFYVLQKPVAPEPANGRCQYCGQKSSGDTCPHCGAPSK